MARPQPIPSCLAARELSARSFWSRNSGSRNAWLTPCSGVFRPSAQNLFESGRVATSLIPRAQLGSEALNIDRGQLVYPSLERLPGRHGPVRARPSRWAGPKAAAIGGATPVSTTLESPSRLACRPAAPASAARPSSTGRWLTRVTPLRGQHIEPGKPPHHLRVALAAMEGEHEWPSSRRRRGGGHADHRLPLLCSDGKIELHGAKSTRQIHVAATDRVHGNLTRQQAGQTAPRFRSAGACARP